MTEKRKHTGCYKLTNEIIVLGKSKTILWPESSTEQITRECLKCRQKK